MANYSNIQREINIVKRAVDEFNFKVNDNKSLSDLYCDACEVIQQGTKGYDRIIEGELSSKNEHLYFDDDMGFTKDIDGDYFLEYGERSTWFRYDEQKMKFVQIKNWYDVDTDNDYCLCDINIDSEGKVIWIIAQPC